MKNNIKRIILLLFTFLLLYFVFHNINFSEFFRTFKDFDCRYIFPLVVLVIMTQTLRAVCYKQLIHKTAPEAKLSDIIFLCLASAGANIILPARAGDIFRAYFTGKKYGADKIKVFGSVMMERLFDVIVIFLFLITAIMLYHKTNLAVRLCTITGILVVSGILFAVAAYKFNKTDKICSLINEKIKNFPFHSFIQNVVSFINKTCNSFFNGFEVIDSPRRIIYALFASIGIWTCECLCYTITIYGFGYDLHWSISLFIVTFTALGCMIPSASVFLGPYQIAVIAAFAIYNISKETALAVSVMEQSVVAIVLCFVTFLFLFKNNISYKEIKEKIEQNQQ